MAIRSADAPCFAQNVASNLTWLRQNGHPKWKSVDLDFPLKGWEQYDCVQKYVRRPGAPAATAAKAKNENPVLDALKQMLD